MKYGKEFQQILDDPSLPPDWKTSAIEYRRLKKLIKDVAAELSGMGLSPDVLHKLLATRGMADQAVTEEESSENDKEDDGDVLEFEFESPDNSPPSLGRRASAPESTGKFTREAQEVVLDPVPDQEDAALSSSAPHHHHHKKFRLRLLSETQPAKPVVKPMGVMDMVKLRTEPQRRAGASSGDTSPERDGTRKRGRRVVRRAVADNGAVKAEYVLVGDSSQPTPQLRLHLSTTPSPDRGYGSSGPASSYSASVSAGDSEADPTTSESENDDEEDEAYVPRPAMPSGISSPHRTPRAAFSYLSPRLPQIDVIPPSPTLNRLRQAVSPIWALASGTSLAEGLHELNLDKTPKASSSKIEPIENDTAAAGGGPGPGPTPPSVNSASGPAPSPSPQPSGDSPATERDFIIPLAADVAFFSLLTRALTSLSEFHAAQQELFRASVEELCGMIRASIQPGSASPVVMPTPFTPTPIPGAGSSTSTTVARKPPVKASKKDLYAWREIFTLWIEHEIFESSAERTRGERTVEQAQARLQAFANEVVKRGLGDRRTIKGKKSRGAWEEFLRLNVLLLDLKRFQMANINAARKILKKHDKRTALTASAGFPDFVRSTLANTVDINGNVSTWNFYNTSLPHVLLASLTDTLLPILPSLDDYACLICTSIAFKPIRLGCGHLFCVRCLVKMQRAGKGECPLCRSQVVLLANKDSLDLQLMSFMKEWFPKEVKEKQRENDREIAIEHAGGSGLVVPDRQVARQGPHDPRCVIM